MRNFLLLLAGLLATSLAAAEEVLNFDTSKRSCVAHSDSSWGYYGQLSSAHDGARQQILLPNDWGQHYAACGRGSEPLHRQSPIELPAAEALPMQGDEGISLGGNSRVEVSLEHNCHTVQATIDDHALRTLTLAGQDYRLLQFHIHTPSEHVIDGGADGTSNYPGEIHFVHVAINDDGSTDPGRLAVVGVFMDVAETAPLPRVDAFFHQMSTDYQGAATAPGQAIAVDLDQLVRGGQRFWRYQGSLTTPPCSEIVEWIVLEEPLVLSTETYGALRAAKLNVGFANARPPVKPTDHHQLRLGTR